MEHFPLDRVENACYGSVSYAKGGELVEVNGVAMQRYWSPVIPSTSESTSESTDNATVGAGIGGSQALRLVPQRFCAGIIRQIGINGYRPK